MIQAAIVFLWFQFSLLVQSQTPNLLSTDPDKNALVHEYIASRGFNWQFYSVPTNDGYFIGVYRIVHPFGPATKRPVLCAPPASGSSKVWLRNDVGGDVNEPLDVVVPNLGFEIAKRGYDVWLVDWRGNYLDSYQHVNYTLNDIEYYDWSQDERALFDLPAAIDFVRRLTGRKKIALMVTLDSTTYYFMLASMVPRFNHVVQPVIALTPGWTFVEEINAGPAQKALVELEIRALVAARGALIPGIAYHNLVTTTCNLILTQRLVCNPILFLLSEVFLKGLVGSVNYDRLTVYFTTLVYGQSKWDYAQQMDATINHNVRMLDVNPEENMRRYGGRPLEYMPERITNPEIHIFQSVTQRQYTVQSFRGFKKRLGTRFRSEHLVPANIPWSAMSFLDATPEDDVRYVNEPVLRILDSYRD